MLEDLFIWLRRFGVRVKRRADGGTGGTGGTGVKDNVSPDGASSMDGTVMATLAAYGRCPSEDVDGVVAQQRRVAAASTGDCGSGSGGSSGSERHASTTPYAILNAPPGFGMAVAHIWYAHNTTMAHAHSVAPLSDDAVGPSARQISPPRDFFDRAVE